MEASSSSPLKVDASSVEGDEEEGKEGSVVSTTQNIPGAGLSIIFIFGSLLYGALLKVFCRFVSVLKE